MTRPVPARTWFGSLLVVVSQTATFAGLECFTMYVTVRLSIWGLHLALSRYNSRIRAPGPRVRSASVGETNTGADRMSATSLEREIKLRFDSVEEARKAVLAAGCTPRLGRRLQADALLDTDDEELRRRRCVLRVRVEDRKSTRLNSS